MGMHVNTHAAVSPTHCAGLLSSLSSLTGTMSHSSTGERYFRDENFIIPHTQGKQQFYTSVCTLQHNGTGGDKGSE